VSHRRTRGEISPDAPEVRDAQIAESALPATALDVPSALRRTSSSGWRSSGATGTDAGVSAGKYSTEVPQQERIQRDAEGRPGTVTCGYGRRWTCCLLFASRGSSPLSSTHPGQRHNSNSRTGTTAAKYRNRGRGRCRTRVRAGLPSRGRPQRACLLGLLLFRLGAPGTGSNDNWKTPTGAGAYQRQSDRCVRRQWVRANTLGAAPKGGWGGSGGASFEPDGAEVVASGEAHVGVECGGQAP
jgi:hypothetical protein